MLDDDDHSLSGERIRVRSPIVNRTVRFQVPEPRPTTDESEPPSDDEPARSSLSSQEILELVERHATPGNSVYGRGTRSRRRTAVRMLLEWLERFPGTSWQERWRSSGAEDQSEWQDAVAAAYNEANGTKIDAAYPPTGAAWLIALDVVRPATSGCSAGLDYTSLTGLVVKLVVNFWNEIEYLSPGIESLRLSPELVDAWKERVRVIRHGTKAGRARKDHGALLIAVRAFYFDVNDWAQADPERYGRFASPNLIGPDDTRAFAKEKRRQRSQSHQRTRERQPLLPALLGWVSDSLRWHAKSLDLAKGTAPGVASPGVV